MPLSVNDIQQIAAASKTSTAEWREFAKMIADAQSGDNHFSSINRTGAAGGRGEESLSHRKYEREYDTEIKLKKLANSNTRKMLKAFEEVSKVISPELKSFRQDIGAVSDTLDSHFQKIGDTFEDAQSEIKFWTKHTTKSGKTVFHLEQQMRYLNDKLEDQNLVSEERLELEKELVKVQSERAEILKKATKNLSLWNKALAAGAVLLAGAGRAGQQMMGDVEAQRRFGTPGSMMGQIRAGTIGGLTGIDPALMSELMATNRAALIAMGGNRDMESYYENLGSRLDELANIAGTRTEALKFELTTMQNLVRTGIEPTTAAMNEQIKHLEFAQEAMGMTAEEFASLQTQLVTDGEFRKTLNGLDERQRRNRLNEMNDQIALNRANGMMKDQAIAAAIALENLAGKGPRDRIKEMAKLQAIAAAAGIQMSDEARNAFIKGRSATDSERTARQEFMSAMGDRLTEISATMGGTGMEFGIFGAMEKAGISMDMFDNSLTNLGEKIRMEDGPDAFVEQNKRMVEQMGLSETAFNNLTLTVEKVMGVLNNIAGGGMIQSMLSGLTTGIGAFFGAKAATSGLGGMLNAAKLAAGGVTLAGTAAATSAGIGLWQGGQAVTTGRSDIHDFMTGEGGTGFGNWVSEKLGALLHGDLGAVVGFEESAARAIKDDKHAVEAAAQRDKQTDQSAKQLSSTDQLVEIAKTSLEHQIGATSNEKALARIGNMDNQGSVV